ncbi:MAG: Omp28-related outer membrane protein [Saprospiraceae bacterium]
MKKTTFMLMLCCLFILKGFAQQVVPVQASLITKRTATWCPNCGTWGWSLFNNLREANQGKAVFFAAHYSGDLANPLATELTTNFGAAYQPVFYFNETNQEALPSNTASILSSVTEKVGDAFTTAPIANVGFDSTYSGGDMTVNAKVKFFQPASGEYYLGIYLVEDNVTANQSGIGQNANHMRVLRASFSSSTWGELIGNGSFSAGDEFTKTFAMPVDNPSDHSYELAGVIWLKEGDKYKVVNAWTTDIQGGASAQEEASAFDQFYVAPTVTETAAVVHLQLSRVLDNASLELYDVGGTLVKRIFAGNLGTGVHDFNLDLTNESKGLYLVKFAGEGQTRIEKLVVQ